jgi:hypothetical protein
MFENPFAVASMRVGFTPQLQSMPKAQRWECTDAIEGGVPIKHVCRIPFRLVWGSLYTRIGIKRPIKGRYAEIMVSLDDPMPKPPPGSDEREWKVAGDSLVWLDEHEDQDGRKYPASLRRLVFDGATNLRVLTALYHSLSYRKEMQAGQLPVLLASPFHPYSNTYGDFGAPVLEPIGFVDPDVEIFGLPINKPPTVVLGGPAAARQLDPPTPSPANDHAPAVTTPKPANDPLGKFRPAQFGDRVPF